MSAFLNRRVLVLNQSYEPIMVIGAKRAIILILSEKVDALENYRELIHSASSECYQAQTVCKDTEKRHSSFP